MEESILQEQLERAWNQTKYYVPNVGWKTIEELKILYKSCE